MSKKIKIGKKSYTKEQIDLAYENGKPLMSDADYDKAFKNASGKLKKVKASEWQKFKHLVPMFSLNKTEVINTENNLPFFDNLKKWLYKLTATYYVYTRKYDGAAIVLYYKNGELFAAVTRGDGEVGDDVTRNILKAKNVLKTVPKNIKALVGEVVLEKKDFEKLAFSENNLDGYSNPRNGATGALKDFEGRNAKHLTVKYHNVILYREELKSKADKLKLLKKMGLKDIWYKKITKEDAIKVYHEERENRDNLGYEVDGLVFEVNDLKKQNKLGRDSSGNPKYATALKFPYQRKSSVLESIENSVGNSGVITPVAIFKEIDLGVKVTRASLANYEKMQELWGGDTPRVGDIIEVSRRGDVVPKVEAVLQKNSKGKLLTLASKCPVCDSSTVVNGPMLECSNLNCESRQLGDIYKWAWTIKEHFKVKGLGGESIYQMFQLGLIKNAADLYKLKPEDLMSKMEGVREKKAKNILEFQNFTEIPLEQFLGGLNIPNVGKGVFKFLIEAGYDSLTKLESITKHEIAAVQNMGEIRARLVLIGLKSKQPLIKSLLKHVSITKPKKIQLESKLLEGKTFLITGKLSQPRSYFEEKIKLNGGKMASGVSKNLNYLIVGTDAGSKLTKAESLGVKIIGEKDFDSFLKT